MGWGTGTYLMEEVIDVVNNNVDSKVKRKNIFIGLIESFENYDADDLCSIDKDPIFTEALKEYHPDWYED